MEQKKFNNTIDEEEDGDKYPIKGKKKMPKWELDDDIVISGIGGRFPESDNLDEFAANLFNNVDMVTEDDRRWPKELNDGLGSRSGKIKELDKFDSIFFSTLTLLGDAMDPQARILLETTYECIVDAGINPQTLRGTKTGVYVGVNTVACADGLPQDDFQDVRRKEAALWVQGSSKALYANRISFLFDLIGPSTLIDTACSSSMVAFTNAIQDLRCGNCDMAIVASANLCPAPFSNHIYQSIGLLASDGKCKVWDKRADGFVRSETVACLFLQKKSEARRNYSTVLHAKTNTDGFKSIGLFSPFWLRQRNLMIETYQEAGVDPNDIKFFEAHGTGTNVGDPQEAKAIAEAYCSNGRKDPLLLGAVKSNLGHSEGASGLCSIAKVVLAFENKCIPANLHFKEAKSEIEVVVKKILVPVTVNTPYNNGIAGVNSFGVGGVNAHALLKSNDKELNSDSFKIADVIPRLVNICGRTEEAMNHYFNFIENNPNKISRDFLALLCDTMKTFHIPGSMGFPYRGFMIIKEKIDDDGTLKYEYKKQMIPASRNTSVWLFFSGMGSQWTGMAKSLMPINTFSKSITRAANVLKPYNIDLMNLLLSNDTVKLKNTTHAFVSITAMQIALFDLIKEFNFKIDGIVGHSFGEVACAYADGCLTLEQAILTSYWRGKIVQNSKLPRGMLAAVGLSWEEAKKKCPPGIVPACHNGSDSVTISGLYDDMVKFVEHLKSENIFAREVAGGDFPYHSPLMKEVVPELIDALNTVIKKPKGRSKKWLSTSWNEDKWNNEEANYASAEYFTNNLVSPVLFNEAMKKIPKNSVVIEVAPHSLFESIFKRCFSDLTYVGLMKRNETDNLDYILSSIGKLYCLGLNPDIENLYPKVEWPVSRGTQSVGSLFKWDHDHSYAVRKYPEFHNFATASDFSMKFSLQDMDFMFLKDHAVDGRVLFPATGYLMLVWRRLAAQKGQPWMKTPVVFENVRFHRPTLLSDNNEVRFTIRIMEGTGDFTISEGNSIVATGCVHVPEENILELQDKLETDEDIEDDDNTNKMHEILQQKEIYKELRIRGYDYGPKFQGLIEARGDGKVGKCKWTGQWISFLDSVMHLALVALPIRALFVPVGFQSVRCDPNILFEAIKMAKQSKDNHDINETMEQDNQMDEINDEFSFSTIVSKANPNLSKEEHEETEKLIKDQVGATLRAGEDKIASELLGIETFGNDDDELSDVVKDAILPVKFDFNLRAMVTKGIEIRGFIPVNIPRRPIQSGLTIEKYQFIPHNEEFAIDNHEKDNIVEYINVCCSLMIQLLNANGINKKLTLNGYREADEDIVKKYIDNPKDNHILLKVINDTIAFKFDENLNVINNKESEYNLSEAIKTVLSKPENDLTKDLLNLSWTNERIIRPFLDIVLENTFEKNFKILEMNSYNGIVASNIINKIKMSVIGIINTDYIVANPTPSNIPEEVKSSGLKILEWDNDHLFLNDITGLDLLIYKPSNNILQQWKIETQVQALFNSIKDGGFLILSLRNKLSPPEEVISEFVSNHYSLDIVIKKSVENFINTAERIGFQIIGRKCDSITSSLALFRKIKNESINYSLSIINVKNGKYNEWLEPIKERFIDHKDSEDKSKTWLIANDTNINGIIGLTNCLRLEIGGHKIRCIYDHDKKLTQDVNFNLSPYKELKTMDLVFNVYKNGQWGTYRHIVLPEEQETIETEHAYLNVVTRGDMGSLKWFDAQHKHWPNLTQNEKNSQEILCHVYYSALNFKDVVLVSGKIQPGPESALFDCIIGLEFAGRRSDTGARVMGMVPFKGIATTLITYKDYLWEIPDEWTLEDAATIPVVFCTAYYALITRGQLQEGESVLIHSGAGGVGQAAIMICQSMNCDVYVTVGNKDKREFLKQKFNLDDAHIANSHDTTFERHIMKVTKGNGVDVVLNSLTEDKLQASVRCLAANGRFLEIGKYDMQMNKQLGLFAFLQNISFHGVGLDCIFREGPSSKKLKSWMNEMSRLLNDGIKRGIVKPIERTTFEKSKAEDAFRYMTTGKHIGKVLIKIRSEEPEKIVLNPKPMIVSAITRTWFHPSKVYIITGGMGGCGLELSYWMVLRGAKKIILTSRTGIKNAYQQLYLKRFKEYEKFLDNYEIKIMVLKHNAITIDGANQLIDDANNYGPIGGIFNLALVLNDAYIENQTLEQFKEVCEPKVDGLQNLDLISREKCPQLDYFVAFSSLTSGRGNGGQSNYGYANSAMERICEERREKGFPGLTIQWGPIGDVGIVAEGFLDTESKSDALKSFGGILFQRFPSCLDILDRFMQTSYPVVSSIVKADLEHSGSNNDDEVLTQLCNHLGIDKRSPHESLGDIGLDSMMAVEMQQRLERDYDISLTLTDIKKITVGELKEFKDGSRDSIKQYEVDIKKARVNLSAIKFDVPIEPITYLNEGKTGKPLYFLPPIEGIFKALEELAITINRPVIGINWTKTMKDMNFSDVKKVSDYYAQKLKQLSPEGDYDILGHSFGAVIGLHMIRKHVPIGKLFILDPSDVGIRDTTDGDERFEFLFAYCRSFIPIRIFEQVEREVLQVKGEQSRVNKLVELLKHYGGKHLQGKEIDQILKGCFQRADMIIKYKKKNIEKINSHPKQTQQIIKKKLKKINTDVTHVKLLKKEIDLDQMKMKILHGYGIKKEDFEGSYDIHTIIGVESDFLSQEKGNVQTISNIINQKLTS